MQDTERRKLVELPEALRRALPDPVHPLSTVAETPVFGSAGIPAHVIAAAAFRVGTDQGRSGPCLCSSDRILKCLVQVCSEQISMCLLQLAALSIDGLVLNSVMTVVHGKSCWMIHLVCYANMECFPVPLFPATSRRWAAV